MFQKKRNCHSGGHVSHVCLNPVPGVNADINHYLWATAHCLWAALTTVLLWWEVLNMRGLRDSFASLHPFTPFAVHMKLISTISPFGWASDLAVWDGDHGPGFGLWLCFPWHLPAYVYMGGSRCGLLVLGPCHPQETWMESPVPSSGRGDAGI